MEKDMKRNSILDKLSFVQAEIDDYVSCGEKPPKEVIRKKRRLQRQFNKLDNE